MRVIEMINLSHQTIPVVIGSGNTVYVPPRGRVVNEDVKNLDEIRPFFKIREALNETAPKSRKKNESK